MTIQQSSVGFLDPEELERLTGYAPGEKKRQREWLQNNGYVYMTNARGENVVLWEHVRERLCLNQRSDAEETTGPDLAGAFAHLRERKRSRTAA